MLRNAVGTISSSILLLLLTLLIFACGGGLYNKIGLETSPAKSANNQYDREFRDQSRSSNQDYKMGGGAFAPDLDDQEILDTPGWNQPYIESGERPDINEKHQQTQTDTATNMADRIESWFVPKAYAEDHGLDEMYLVRKGDCSITVENHKDAAASVESTAAKYDGYVTDSRSQKNTDGTVSGWIKLRIPNDQFFHAWLELLKIGEVTEQNTSSEDVSQQYVGYVSKLKNLNAEQAVLEDMLTEAREVQKSRGLGEAYTVLLQTQERLSDVTGEIQSTEDRLTALADKVTRSTITVNLTEKKKLPAQVKEQFTWGISETAAMGFKDLKFTLRNSLQRLTYFLVTCWTWVIPWAIIIWVGLRLWKRGWREKVMNLLARKPLADQK